jgi:hypothetical protein
MIDSVKVVGAEKSRIHNIDQAIEETAINMLKQNLDLKLIAQVTGLSLQLINQLKNTI